MVRGHAHGRIGRGVRSEEGVDRALEGWAISPGSPRWSREPRPHHTFLTKSGADQMSTVQLSATGGRLTSYPKRIVARSWYTRGKSFLGAAVLLQQHGGHGDVVLHLLCQGIEILLKSLLLFIDYDAHKPKLKKYRHDLAPLAARDRAVTQKASTTTHG
jgi:hypothetical protein